MLYYAAPMEGITSYIWRNAHHRWYPGIAKYYTPFLVPRTKRGYTKREKSDILPEHNEGIPLVPQVLTRSGIQFIDMAQRLHELSYGEVNLNLGCPSGTVVSKGKGSGFLKEPEVLKTFFDEVFEEKEKRRLNAEISVKTRLGVTDPEEIYALMDIYNRFPIAELVIHARVQKDMYRHPARPEIFGEAIKGCGLTICYNGDIFSPEDGIHFQREYPEITRVMLGRGLIANPQLHEMIKVNSDRDLARLKSFLDEVCEGYQEIMSGDRNVLFKMKELWSLILPQFPGPAKVGKHIRKAATLSEYRVYVDEWFYRQEPPRSS